MKRKIKLKLPFFILLIALVPTILFSLSSLKNKEKDHKKPDIIEESQIYYPVINEDNNIIYPYSNESVKIGKSYYDYKAEEQKQEESLIMHDNTYYQNTGIDFTAKDSFDVLAIANGTVTSVKEDNATGKTIEIKHDNGLISIYQSLSEIAVKKNDVVSQGQVIGKSGNNELDKELGNHVHLELYENGQSVNPELYLGKKYEKKN